MATRACQSYTAIWVRLLQLSTEFYDRIILAKIRNTISKLLKIDACTSSIIRGRYTRLCVQLSLEQKVQSHIRIGSHKQIILYEGDNILCKICGCLGHSSIKCPHSTTQSSEMANGKGQTHHPQKSVMESGRLSPFPRKRN